MRIRYLVGTAIVMASIFIMSACGETDAAHTAIPTYQSKNYIERQIFNHRLRISDDPSTVLFCTAFPFDAKPYTVPIAGKLVSGTKRPDPLTEYNGNNDSEERQDAQGMYGSSVPYRFGFTPGGVYKDFTDIPTLCSTEAVSYKETSIGLVESTNGALTNAGHEAQSALREGLVYGDNGHGIRVFQGYSRASQQKAQAILDNAVNNSSTGTVASPVNTGKVKG